MKNSLGNILYISEHLQQGMDDKSLSRHYMEIHSICSEKKLTLSSRKMGFVNSRIYDINKNTGRHKDGNFLSDIRNTNHKIL